MCGKDDRGLRGIAQSFEPRIRQVVDHHVRSPGSLGRSGVMEDNAVDMRELGRDAPEVLPDAAENLFDLVRRLIRKRGAQVLAPGLVRSEEHTSELQSRAL